MMGMEGGEGDEEDEGVTGLAGPGATNGGISWVRAEGIRILRYTTTATNTLDKAESERTEQEPKQEDKKDRAARKKTTTHTLLYIPCYLPIPS